MVYVGTKQGEILALELAKDDKSRGQQPSVKWRFAPEGEARVGSIFGMPAIGKDFVYVGDSERREGRTGNLYALRKDRDASSTNILERGEWVKPIEGAIVGGPALAEGAGLVLVGSDDGNLYAFDTTGDAPGRRAWRFRTGGQIWSTPVVGDGVAYFGSMDRYIYAVSLEEDLSQAERELWKYKTGGAVISSPLLFGDMVIAGSFDEKLYALDSKTGELVWSFKGDDWFWAGAVSSGELIFAASMGGTVYGLDSNGTPTWFPPFQAESPITSTPVVVGDDLVVGTDEGKLHILRTSNGEKLEVFKDLGDRVKAPLSKHGDMVFVGLEDSTVRGINVEQWVERWRVSTKK